jgi:N-acetylglutamate synthase-like GNAT family acetyltransferase
MTPAGVIVRRATLDDLETLRGLWRECRLPEFELERRFTEFQLAVDDHGWILGAVGIRFAGAHGQAHSLAIRRADLEAELQALLWERTITLAHQHGAHRLWTREHGPFWTAQGFQVANAHERRDLPPALGNPADSWLTLKLRDEPLKVIAAEEQLEAYLELERLKTDQMLRRGRILKLAATALAGFLFLLLLAALLLILRRSAG